jgi:hypothetical protein
MRNWLIGILAALILLAGLAFWIEKHASYFDQARHFQNPTVPTSMLDWGKLGNALKKARLVTTVPNEPENDPHYARGNPVPEETHVCIRIHSARSGIFKIYWADADQAFDESRWAAFRYNGAEENYFLVLPSLAKINRLKVDPLSFVGEVRIDRIDILSPDYHPIRLSTKRDFEALEPVKHIAETFHDGTGLVIRSSGIDPGMVIAIEPIRNHLPSKQALFRKKRQSGPYRYAAVPGGAEMLPSNLPAQSPLLKKDCPTLSIHAAEKDFYDPDEGLLTNKMMRGRQWEKPGSISYYEEGNLLFAANAGIRVHGGKRLQMVTSYRLYFRNRYGTDQFAPGILFGPKTEPLRRLVVHHTGWPPEWPLNNVLAYDIARRIGCVVPETKLVRLVINQQDQGLYFLTTHLNQTQMASYFGHEDFSLYRSRSENAHESIKFYHHHIKALAYTRSVDLSMAEVSARIDDDNLARHFLSFIFCGTTDHCQGVLVKDNRQTDSKAFMINWDMDHSFIDVAREVFKQKRHENRLHFRQPGWSRFVKENENVYCAQQTLFTRLLNEVPEYRQQVLRLTMDLLNHRINAEFLSERLDYYESQLRTCEFEYREHLRKLREFCTKRPDFIRDEMQTHFALGASHLCRLKAPAGMTLTVDGYPESDGYTGWYFASMPIRVELADDDRARFSHWRVNGRTMADYPLMLAVDEPTTIEAVFEDDR